MEYYAYLVKIDNLEDQNPVDLNIGISPRFNFDIFGQAVLTVFCLIVNEDWN